jgi:putrescine transport system permease protein
MRRFGLLFWLLIAGFAFLYLPILVLVLYSFNASDRVAVWGGWSLKWYAALLDDRQLLSAAWLSVQIAAISATGGALIGSLAGLCLARFGAFKGRALLAGMVGAPLVMPEVITGLSLLLLFVSMEQALGWPQGRGMMTIAIAHVTFCAAYVAVIVQSRLAGLDQSIEEAAQDLGARPWKVFLLITVPMIAPGLVAGWLLAFTLSLDDLVIASFVSGPGSSTLPMVVFSKVRLGISPEINALATIIVGLVATGAALSVWMLARGDRHRRSPSDTALGETSSIE